MPTRLVTFDSLPEPEDSQPAADRLLRGDPRQRIWNLYGEAGGRFFAGRWASTPGAWRVRYTEHEFCHVLSGRMRIVSGAGDEWTFGAGDSFVVPAGFEGTWEVLEDAVKLYAIFEPPAG
jgi:uncharacterized cupin superfamily protein